MIRVVARIPYLKSLEALDYRYLKVLDHALNTYGDVGMGSVTWYYAARDWTSTEAKAAGRSWRTQVRLTFSICLSGDS